MAAPPGDFSAAAAALVCSVTSRARQLHPEPSTPAAAARQPLWPSSHLTPSSACFPAFSFFLVNSVPAGRLAKLRLKTEREKKNKVDAPASLLQSL